MIETPRRVFRSLGTFLALCAIATFVLAVPAAAQQVFGSIFGTITDPSGSAVTNASITITDTNKGTTFTTTTNESGNYTKGQLIPGVYTVSIEAPGFQKVVSSPISVEVDQSSKFDAALTVGSVNTEVEVTAAAPLLQADRADVAQTLTSKEINELPSIGRNLQAYELLNPGTVRIGWAHASDENPQGSVQMFSNGQLFETMGYELDGTTNQDPILGIIVINPTFDSVSEVKQANQNFDAEFEYVGGGLASYSTKSGTNSFHGDAFEYLQVNTPGFQDFARDPFTNANPVYRENQFGGSIGGKILKDKLFFFGDAQLIREAQGGSVLTSVPTAAERNGDLSDWLALSPNYQAYNPNTGDPTTGQGREKFTNNQIPQSLLSPQALKILSYFPLPNINTNQPFNNYAASGDITITSNQWDTRWDYYASQKSSIFGRYSYAQYLEFGPGAFGLLAGGPTFVNYAGNSEALNQSLSLGWTYTASPTLVNELRFGYMRYHVFDTPNGYGTSPAADAGIPGLNLDKTYTSGMPYFDIQQPSGYDEKLGYALGVNQCNCPLTQTERQYQVIDNVHKTWGNHNFKFGADIRYAENLRVPSDSHRAGELYFGGGQTGTVASAGAGVTDGLGLASFLLGDVSGFSRYVSSSTDAEERQKRWFFYSQDEWRVTPKFTFTYGFRWEMVFPETVNERGNGATFNLDDGQMYVFGVAGVSTHGIQKMNWHTLAPRIGLAYQLNSKTVVRAGYGWSYDLGTFGSTFGHNVTQNPPVLLYQNPAQPYGGFGTIFNLADGPPAPPTVTVGPAGTFPLPVGVTPKFRPAEQTLPTIYQYNAAVQRQVSSKISLTAAYVGNVNRHSWLGTSNTINPNEAPFVPGVTNTTLDEPYFQKFGISQSLQYYCNCANDMYNSLQVIAEVKNLRGWTVQGNYTYQRQYGDGWDPYDSNYYFLYDRQGGLGYNGNLPRNQITIAQSYDIPFGRGRQFGSNLNRPTDYVLGGWTISGITQFYSGQGLSPTLENYGTDANGNAISKPNIGPSGRPDVGNGSFDDGAAKNRNQWFVANPSAYAIPAANTFGNYPINVLFGPHYIQQDVSIQKWFAFNERIGLQFRFDATNFFNHTNLATPNMDVQSPAFGTITGLAFGGLNGMRRLQYSATIRF